MSTSSPFNLLVMPESPWLGLRSFDEEAQAYFFGRQAELDDLYERILDKPLTILFGQSGLGKSSLLKAALVPRLRQAGLLPVLVRLDHDTAAPILEEQVIQHLKMAVATAGFESQAKTLSASARSPAMDAASFLWLLFHDPVYGFLPGPNQPDAKVPRPVFIIDQFEEIFTLGEKADRRAGNLSFRDTLASLVENRPPASLRTRLEEDDDFVERVNFGARPPRVLLSLREDFLHVLERWRRTMPSLMENRFELRMLSGPQAFEAVVRPGQLRPGTPAIIPDEVGQAIVRFVAGADKEVPLSEIDAVPPLLSLVCAELNSQRLSAGETQITRDQFEGRSDEILKSFYHRSFESASYGTAMERFPDAGVALQTLQRLIEDRLLSPDGFRESIAFDTIAHDLARTTTLETANATLTQIIERRLLTVEKRGGVRRLELAHDVLAPIVKASRDERQEREALSNAKREQERAEKEKQRTILQRNRLRRWVALSATLSILALVAAGVAFMGWKKAQAASRVALAQAEQAELEKVRADAAAEGEKQATAHAKALANEAISASALAKLATNEALAATKREEQAKEEAQVAARQAETAREQADESAESEFQARREIHVGYITSFSGLTNIYNKYTAKTLESIPGISAKQSTLLKSKLRSYLLHEFGKIASKRPEALGTIYYLALLQLDEGRDAILDARFPEANIALNEAMQLARKLPNEKMDEAEILADIMLEQTRVCLVLQSESAAVDMAANSLEDVNKMAERWPSSWRLKYVEIRLENILYGSEPGPDTPRTILALAERLLLLADPSGRHFDILMWHFILRTHCSRLQAKERPSALEYKEDLDLISWYRMNLAENSKLTIGQHDQATNRFNQFLEFLDGRFSHDNSPSTAEARRTLLQELELVSMVTALRLPNNQNAHITRGHLLNLQESGMKDGVNTRSANELKSARETQRIVESNFTNVTGLTDILVAAFKTYEEAKNDAALKQLALEKARGALGVFEIVDFIGADKVLRNRDLMDVIEKLRETKARDALLELYTQMLDHYVSLYQQADLDLKTAHMGSFAMLTQDIPTAWFEQGEYDKIVTFYWSCFDGVPVDTIIWGDKEALVRHLNVTIRSLLKSAKYYEGEVMLTGTLALCDNILRERPWDWYVKDAYRTLCFQVAAVLRETGHPAEAQDLLKRGWTSIAKSFGEEDVLHRVTNLPLRGELPAGASDHDAVFFGRLLKDSPSLKGEARLRIAIPTDFDGTIRPFYFYLIEGPNGLEEFQDQVRWVKEIRGGTVPQEIIQEFIKLWEIAKKNKASFPELCASKMSTDSVSKKNRAVPKKNPKQ